MNHNAPDETKWRRAVAGVLKGASFDEVLTTVRSDGTRLAPVYPRKKDAAPIEGRAPAEPWSILQRVDHPDTAAVGELLREDLEGGADGLVLVASESPFARGFGVALSSHGGVASLLGCMRFPQVALRLDAGAQAPQVARWIGEIEGATIHYGYDPVGLLAAQGALPPAWEQIARVLAGHRQGGTALAADGRIYHEAGAATGLELAATLSVGLLYLRELEHGGMALEEGRQCLGFVLAADQIVFETLTKFRALRLLWQRIEFLCGLVPRPVHVHAESAWRMQSRRDPATNLLRNTLATAAAGLGGADSVTTLPFTLVNGLPDAHARRIARNCQHVLLSEANLHRIADPAAGSGGLEAMTMSLCESAWAQFQAIERQGGIVEALTTGWLQAEIDRTRAPVGTIVGANKFTLAEETPVSVLRPRVAEKPPESSISALIRSRDAEPFEAVS